MIARSSQNVINIINRITAMVVVIGGTSLFVVLAGFAGLKMFTLSFSTIFDPDLTIIPSSGKFISLTDEDIARLDALTEIAHYSQIVEEQVFLTHQQKNHIAHIKGVDNQYVKVCPVDSIMALGMWNVHAPNAVVGATIFNTLGLGFLDASSPLQIVVPKSGKGSITQSGKPYREAYAVVAGVYQITEELDKKYVFTSIETSREILGLEDGQISSVAIKISPTTDINKATQAILEALGDKIQVKNRMQLNDALYRMLNTENIAVYLIFTLVLIVALFNLVGAIIMMLLDKREDLRTLHAMGMSVRDMRRVFFLQGAMISFGGALAGVLLGICIVALQQSFHLVMISRNLPYPVAIEWGNTVAVFCIIFGLGLLASWAASSRITQKLIS
ncbi:MAG: FtsX-like permease family protein [Capnocytophaga sp.]|nr:FtsX-like permease family protein [Capnocytophaga sp.]